MVNKYLCLLNLRKEKNKSEREQSILKYKKDLKKHRNKKATKDSWKNIPMGNNVKELDINIILSNEDEGKICEVTQKYIIKIKRDSFENIPIEFELYKDEYCTESVEQDGNGYYIAEEFILDANERQTNTHYLKIYWPEEYNDANLAFEIGYFTIDVISTQLD